MASVGQTYERASEGLPLGRRSPRGQLRWYLVRCHEGREQDTCAKVRQIVPAELLQDAFVPRKERQRKYHGQWQTDAVRLSWGEVVEDKLHVQGGPLVGKEDRVARFVRRKSFASVRVGEGDGAAAMLTMPLAIVARR